MSEGFKYTGPGYYRTHDGRKASVAEHDRLLYGIVHTPTGGWYAAAWGLDGKFSADKPAPFDLAGLWAEPRKISGWVNVYAQENGLVGVWPTREGADRNAAYGRTACIYVTGTEGVEPEGEAK